MFVGDSGDGDVAQFDNGVFEFTAGEMDCIGKNRDGKDTIQDFATERQRRDHLNDKFKVLRNLCPNSIKTDRASIAQYAIEYIIELKRTVNELRVLAERKRCIRERLKRPKAENDAIEGNASKYTENPDIGSTLRSSWLHMKSKM